MSIVDIKKTAKAAAIKIKPEEEAGFIKEIEAIVKMLDQLHSVNTDGVEPLMSVYHGDLRMRQDIAQNSNSEEVVVKSSKNMKYNYFVTPKFVG